MILFYSSTHPTSSSNVSVSSVCWPVARGRATVGGFVSTSFRFTTPPFLVSVIKGNNVGLSFRSSLLNCAANLASFQTTLQCTLQRSKNNLCSVWVMSSFISRTTAVVPLDSCCCPVRLTWSMWTIFFCKERAPLQIECDSCYTNYCKYLSQAGYMNVHNFWKDGIMVEV